VLGAAGVVIYAAAWLLIPMEDADASIAKRAWDRRHERPGRTLALGLAAAAVILLSPHAVALGALVVAAVLWLRDEPAQTAR
jgi:hypothetical protein